MVRNRIRENRIRVALYVRVSSHEQVEGYSIGEQIERLEKYAEALEWDIVKTYVDPGYSGGNTDRPGLKELLKDIKKGEITKVVVYKLDRLSRSQKDTMLLIEDEFLAHGVDFVSMSENFDTSTPFGRAMIGILAVFAQLERENIKERTMIGKEARAKEGKWGGGSSEPIGYTYNITTGELEVNEYEKMQILEAVDLFLKGTPLQTIATLFTKKGYTYIGRYKTPQIWDAKRVRYVLKSRLYIGYIRYADEWYKGTHEPILDEETFNKVQEIFANREKEYNGKYNKKRVQTSVLNGFIYCKQCGARYAKGHGKKWKDNERPYYYQCYSRSKRVPKMVKDPNCRNKHWKMPELDNIVLGEIKKLALEPEYIREIKDEKTNNPNMINKIDIIKDQIKHIDEQISRFMDLYGLGTFTIDQVSQKIDPLNADKKALEAELSTLNVADDVMSDEEVQEIATSLEDILKRGDLDETRLVVESLINYIELDNDDVYIHWKFA
jgi:site-specific DNA recombinase